MNSIVTEKHWIADNLGIPYENLSQSYLRASSALATQSVIDFQLQKGKNQSALVTERLLDLNDQFIITHFTIGLTQIGSDTSTDTLQLNTWWYTWDNPNVFSGTNSVNVTAIYNSSLRFTVNRREFIPSYPVRAFKRVPRTQSNTLTVSSGTATTPTSTYYATGSDSFDNSLYGFAPCEPTLIDGRQTLNVEIDMGASLAMDDSSLINYALFEARGYLVVNSKD